jgi:hypothetical protein
MRKTRPAIKSSQKASHPYNEFEGSVLWKAIDKGMEALVGNGDVREMTEREFIVGYLCKIIHRRAGQVSTD